MDNKRPNNPEIDALLERKKDLLSIFSAFEDRIDHKISHFANSTEAPKVISHETNDPKNDTPTFNKEDLFEQAILKSQQKKPHDGIIGYHTEEILGINEALAALKDNDDTEADVSDVLVLLPETSFKNEPESLNTSLLEASNVPEETVVLSTDEQDPSCTCAKILTEDTPAESSFESQNPDFNEIDTLLNEAEELMGDIPYRRYITARAAVEKEIQNDNPFEKEHHINASFDEEPLPKAESHAFDALFGEEAEGEIFEEGAPINPKPIKTIASSDFYKPEALAPEDFKEALPSSSLESDIPLETISDAPPLDTLDENESDILEEETSESEDFVEASLDEDAFDKETFNSEILDNEDEDTTEAVDEDFNDHMNTLSLGAFKYSAVSLRLALFVLAILGLSVFTALSSGKLVAFDYLILFVLCLFTALTMDMSFSGTLVVTIILMLASFAGIAYTFITSAGFSLYHLFWFLLIPAVLLSASSLVQKIKEIVLANQLLNEELDRYDDTSARE